MLVHILGKSTVETNTVQFEWQQWQEWKERR